MSGHSKWSQIKHQKGKTDRLKGQTFTKLGRAITISVKDSGGISDLDSNFKLRLAVEKARMANMPKTNIDRAISRGLGKGETGNLENITYEGFGPGKSAIIVETSTDNRKRTSQTLKNIFSSYNGNLAGPGSVNYLFKTVGQIIIKKGERSEDEYTELVLEVGGDDIEFAGNTVIIYTNITNLGTVNGDLLKKGEEIETTEIVKLPIDTINLDEQDKAKVHRLTEALFEIDDVLQVSGNYK